MSIDPHGRLRVVIGGGGVAAIEALLALRALCGRRVEVTVIAPEREFIYRPVTVAEAFDRAQARTFDLADLVGERAVDRIVWDTVIDVDSDDQTVLTGSGDRVSYDALIVATGAVAREPFEGALTFRGREDVPALRRLLDDLDRSTVSSVALVLPSERAWSLPIYELALMTAAHINEAGPARTAVTLVTPEQAPLQLFGPQATRAISSLLAAYRVTVRSSALARRIDGRRLVLAGGGDVYADRVIALPVLEGPRLRGLPHDEHGFIPVDSHGRVRGVDHVYAAGDVTSFPLKQGGLAAQQADAAAEQIASEVGVAIKPAPFRPVLRGLLMTEGAPLYLRAEPQRLARETTVAIDAPSRRGVAANASAAAGQPLWWPPSKIAGRYLASYLATARPGLLTDELLADRVAVPGPPVPEAEFHDALELTLLLADCDARWGDYQGALAALAAAEALQGSLPPEYEARRQEWSSAAT